MIKSMAGTNDDIYDTVLALNQLKKDRVHGTDCEARAIDDGIDSLPDSVLYDVFYEAGTMLGGVYVARMRAARDPNASSNVPPSAPTTGGGRSKRSADGIRNAWRWRDPDAAVGSRKNLGEGHPAGHVSWITSRAETRHMPSSCGMCGVWNGRCSCPITRPG